MNNLTKEEQEFLNTLGFLGMAYNKTFTSEETKVWYEMLKEYPDEVLVKVIKDLIKNEQFMPSIARIIEECKKYKKLDRYEVLEQMRVKGYFKTADEYFKAQQWLEQGIMPEWFKEALRDNYNILLDDSNSHYIKQDNTNKQVLLESGDSNVN